MDENQFEKEFMEQSWKIRNRPYQQFVIEDTIKQFLSFLKTQNLTGTLLDIGCGSGKNSVYFAKEGFNVKGIDFTEEAIRISKEHAEDNKLKIDFERADVTQPYDFGKFDVVIDCGCLHHIRPKYWEQYVKNILTATKSGSYFYLHGFSDASPKLGYVPKGKKFDERKGHYTHFFSDEEIENIFGKEFKIIQKSEFENLTGKFIVRAWYMLRK